MKEDEPIDPARGGTIDKVRKAFLAQVRADFGGERRYRRWLFYLALALPAILLPQASSHGLHSDHFGLGWPLSDIHVCIGGDGDGRMYLQILPELSLLLLAPLWCYIASLAWRARAWAKARPDGRGAFTQAALTSLYCVLVFGFLYGVVDLVWTWQMEQADWPGIERAATFAWDWLPWLYVVGAVGIFVTIFLDIRRRPGFLWLAHFAFALGFAFVFRLLAPILTLQLDELNWLNVYAQKQQIEPDSERPRIDARQLDKLEEIFAWSPQFGDAFWRASRRMAHWRGPAISMAVMERSRTWSDQEGLVFVPLLALLPRKSVLNSLNHYDKSEVASQRFWAAEFRTRLEAPDTQEAVQKYSGRNP